MPLIINTNDNNKIEIDDIKPYIKIKLIMSFLNSEDIECNQQNEENEENYNFDMIDMSYDYEFDLDSKHSILTKIFDYSKYIHTIKDLNITEQDMYNYINEFLDCKNETLCDLLNTADYLQYDDLVEVICEKIADDIQKCDNIETIKKKFNIKNIISQEEEEELIKNI